MSDTPNSKVIAEGKAAATKAPARKKSAAKKTASKRAATGNVAARKKTAATPKKAARKSAVKRKPVIKPVSVLIVGAGFAGIGMAIRLKQAGIEDFLILERDTAVGGTWRDNQYPGAACDIPSNLYSYSFAPNPNWSRSFSGSQEILGYIQHMVAEFGLEKHIRFQQNVADLSFDEKAGLWTATTDKKEMFAGRAALMAQGPLSTFGFPDITGIDDFKGKKIHSADWDHDYDFSGKNVAVIGTGASAVQIIPELVKVAKHVKVFQRTPGWVLPRPNFVTPEWNKQLFRKLPASQQAMRNLLYWGHESMALAFIWNSPLTRLTERLSKLHLRTQVKDRWLRRQLTPDFTIGCKRVLMSNDYYPALQKENAKLITWPIARISDNGIRTVEGIEHQVDCVVFATGYKVCNASTPFTVKGLNGRVMVDEWKGGAQAYKSINVSGFPNLFLTFGPNSGPGHNSALVYMESQLEYALKGIRKIVGEDLKVLDVKEEVQARYNKSIQKRLAKTNWNSGCKSWYLTEDGFNATMYPGFATQYAAQMSEFKEEDYQTA